MISRLHPFYFLAILALSGVGIVSSWWTSDSNNAQSFSFQTSWLFTGKTNDPERPQSTKNKKSSYREFVTVTPTSVTAAPPPQINKAPPQRPPETTAPRVAKPQTAAVNKPPKTQIVPTKKPESEPVIEANAPATEQAFLPHNPVEQPSAPPAKNPDNKQHIAKANDGPLKIQIKPSTKAQEKPKVVVRKVENQPQPIAETVTAKKPEPISVTPPNPVKATTNTNQSEEVPKSTTTTKTAKQPPPVTVAAKPPDPASAVAITNKRTGGSFIQVQTVEGQTRTLQAKNIWRLRETIEDEKPSDGWIVDYGRERIVLAKSADRIVHELLGAQKLAVFTAPNGSLIYIAIENIAAINETDASKFSSGSKSVISTKWGVQAVKETQDTIKTIMEIAQKGR